MSREERTCAACKTHPAHLSWLCVGCRGDFESQVQRLPRLRDELEAALVKSGGRPSGGGGSAIAAPLPINLNASDLLADLAAWQRRAWSLLPAGARRPGVTLAGVVPTLVLLPLVGDVAGELWWLYERTRRLAEPPAERVGLGRCTCGADLLAPLDAHRERCSSCGTVHDVQALLAERTARARAVAEADYADQLLSPAAIEALTGGRVRAERIRQWKRRGKLESHPGTAGRPVYRLGDVLEVEGPRGGRA
ncbi:hypothetical protein LG274_02630 [Micrococcus antarcticus]|uniref:hypothetical protein n=1 Tax=Micrococcus antarcticus TaxID=86171 RepID=UPI00384B95E5